MADTPQPRIKHVAEMFGRDVDVDTIYSKFGIIKDQVRRLIDEYGALHGPEDVSKVEWFREHGTEQTDTVREPYRPATRYFSFAN